MNLGDKQRAHYGKLHAEHGHDPRSLGHNDETTQVERFKRISVLFQHEQGRFGVHEIGCGLGHFGAFLSSHYPTADYSGCDVNETFVTACQDRFPGAPFNVADISEMPPAEQHDFVTQSGLFNIRVLDSDVEMEGFVHRSLRHMYAACRKGIASNFLTTLHDPDRTDPALFYLDPGELTRWVTENLSRHVEMDAGGPLYEFTLRIHRPEQVKAHHPEPAFSRYFASVQEA